MRIIAGIHRGRKLVAPEGLTTRPMTDRVRENLFNILAPHMEGAVVLDLFCGSGALGLEALSRGARWCLLVETDPSAIKTAETNVATLRLTKQAKVVRRDALRPGAWIRPVGDEAYTLVFADPPYRLTDEPAGRARLVAMAQALADLGCLAPGATAMLRMRRGVRLEAPWPGFEAMDERTYGTTTLHLMEWCGAREASP
ncbi:MAG: 16S rRNA (guanine(966)-N(2))-methyltransferase RsmD [Phycisphaerae bacterium]